MAEDKLEILTATTQEVTIKPPSTKRRFAVFTGFVVLMMENDSRWR